MGRAERCAPERDCVAVAECLIGQFSRCLIVRRHRVIGVEEIRDVPAGRRRPCAADIIGMNVRIDDSGGCRAKLRQQRIVAIDVPSRINDDGVPIAHEHVAQRPFADAIELHHMRQGRGGRQLTRHIYRFPGGHPADHGVGLVAVLAQKRRRFLARVAMIAHDGDRSRRIERERPEVGERKQLGIRMRVEVELRPKHDVAALDVVRCPHVEHLHRLPTIEPLGELLRRDLGQGRVRHGVSVVPAGGKRNGSVAPGAAT